MVPNWVEETPPPPTELPSQGSSVSQPTAQGRRLLGSNLRGAFRATWVSLASLGVNEVDYCRYPDREIQLQWLRYYLEAQKGTAPTPREVERLYAQVNKFALVSAWTCHQLPCYWLPLRAQGQLFLVSEGFCRHAMKRHDQATWVERGLFCLTA